MAAHDAEIRRSAYVTDIHINHFVWVHSADKKGFSGVERGGLGGLFGGMAASLSRLRRRPGFARPLFVLRRRLGWLSVRIGSLSLIT